MSEKKDNIVSVRVPKYLMDKFKQYCLQNNVTVSKALTSIIEESTKISNR